MLVLQHVNKMSGTGWLDDMRWPLSRQVSPLSGDTSLIHGRDSSEHPETFFPLLGNAMLHGKMGLNQRGQTWPGRREALGQGGDKCLAILAFARLGDADPFRRGHFPEPPGRNSPGTPIVRGQLVQEGAQGQPGRHPNTPTGRRRQISMPAGGGRRVRFPPLLFWSSAHHQAAHAGP